VELAQPLAAEVVPRGRLIASGIFNDREAEVAAAFERVGLAPVGRFVEGDWVALEVRRPRP
jgi:ribosomal protein L11 methylase PrmA